MATKRTALRSGDGSDPIEHVIVLMLENRSFDHFLGDYQKINPKIDGIPPDVPPRTNKDSKGGVFEQSPSTAPTTVRDLPHETKYVLTAIEKNNDGFVRAYEERYRTLNPPAPPRDYQDVMHYFPAGTLPAIDVLARNFLVCDHWYASVPGPTWTNRFFVHSGTSLGRVKMPEGPFDLHLHAYHQETIYDRLNLRTVNGKRSAISWKIYYGDVPQSLLLTHQFKNLGNLRRYDKMPQFFKDAAGPASAFPQYSFIEPNYMGAGQNDDHPAIDVMKGQKLIADVYNAVRKNEDLWKSTLLVLLYDEHGGFYDHISPPKATPPGDDTREYTFDRYGVRVPAILISPWVQADVISEPFDHTSVLRYVADKWQLDVKKLGARVAGAASFGGAIKGPFRADTPKEIRMPAAEKARALAPARTVVPQLTDLQKSLVAMTQVLESEMPRTPDREIAAGRRSLRALAGPKSQEQVARERVDAFFAAKAVARPTPGTKATKKRPAKKTTSSGAKKATAAKASAKKAPAKKRASTGAKKK
jgi:phospholipase C